MARSQKSADAAVTLPHPRSQAELFGHEPAEGLLLNACQTRRMHHAWMICGQKGIGKATLAYRAARFVLANPDGGQGSGTLYVPKQESVFHLVEQGVHPDCHVLELDEKKKSISIDAVRELSDKIRSTSSSGGWRVALIDALEDLNPSAANALLKILEEPPSRCLFLLVSHQPGQVKMTLRSRCQKLHLKPLDDVQIMQVARNVMPELPPANIEAALPYVYGSPGRALLLANGGGLAERDMLRVTLQNLPRLDIKMLQQLSDAIARKGEEAFLESVELIAGWCRTVALSEPSAPYAYALSCFSAKLEEESQRVNVFNLDRKAFLVIQLSELGRLVHLQVAA